MIHRINQKYKKIYFSNKVLKTKNNIIYKIILFLVLFFWLIWILLIYILYSKIIIPLPDVKDLRTIKIPESSIIYDRNWNELYKLYSEKRTYVKYENINQNMINALISWEDKRYWTHPWYDFIGISRAIFTWLLSWNDITNELLDSFILSSISDSTFVVIGTITFLFL